MPRFGRDACTDPVHNPFRRYEDRTAAGEALVEHLLGYRGRPGVAVLGLPRGGVVVAAPIAAALGAPLDVVLVRKLGVPGHPELAMGAVAAVGGDVAVFRHDYVCRRAGVSDSDFARARDREIEELQRRRTAWGSRAAPIDLAGCPVVVVDDGLATGSTMRAAVAAVRARCPRQIVVAVPIAASDVALALAEEVDRVVCPWQPHRFRAVGEAYADFSQTTDEEVARLLAAPGGGQDEDPPG